MTFAVSDRFSTGWSGGLSSEAASSNDLSLTSVGLKDGVSLTQPWEIWEGPTTGPSTGPTLQPPQPQPVYEPITLTGVFVGIGIAIVGGVIAEVVGNESTGPFTLKIASRSNRPRPSRRSLSRRRTRRRASSSPRFLPRTDALERTSLRC